MVYNHGDVTPLMEEIVLAHVYELALHPFVIHNLLSPVLCDRDGHGIKLRH